MKDPKNIVVNESLEGLIRLIRGQRVILDSDLAQIYGVLTSRLNEQVKRNWDRFPTDFMFQLTDKENKSLTSQNAMSKIGRGGRRTKPCVFTEHGAIMAANVLSSPRAVQMSVFVVRAFVKMRETLGGNRHLAAKLEELEQRLTGRLDVHEKAIVHILDEIKKLREPLPSEPEPEHREIGFRVHQKTPEKPSARKSLAKIQPNRI